MKLSHQLVVSSLAVFVLSACSGSAAERRQAKDDFDYLTTQPLKKWTLAEGAKPQFYSDYQIPQGDFKGGVGKQVDIRAPLQVLELIPGARTERKQGETTLWLLRQSELDKVWQTALKMISERDIAIRQQSDTRIETDWIEWTDQDEDIVIGSRYVIERFTANDRYGFKISLIDWREGGKQKPVTNINRERYSALMTNLVTARYDQDLREEAIRKAQQLMKTIPISMGSDRSGFPVIIARTPYNVLWQRLPEILPKMGFTLEERNQSQGTIEAEFASPDDEFWQKIGLKPIELESETYTFLLGDLGNRTSVNITDSKGKPINEKLLKEMVPLLTAMMDK